MSSNKQEYVIGVDGGASKTTIAVANLQGEIVEKAKGGPTNYLAVGEIRARSNLKKIILPLLQKYQNIENIVFGFAGLNNKKDFLVFQRIVRSMIPKGVKFALYNDAVIAMEATCEEKPRILIVAGTGSSALGQNGKKTIKAGGREFLLTDEGSAYDFGIRALRSAVKSFDGRGQKTILESLVLKKAGAKDIPGLVMKVQMVWQKKPGEFKKYVASFTRLLGEAFIKKDKVAGAIIEQGAEELFFGAEAVIKNLGIKNQKICVGYVGSSFKLPFLKILLSAKIKRLAPKAYFISSIESVVGAVKLALKKNNAED
ncbi:MAG: BadF/BadG/BcrA/BcrD ATPase family protein [bacterium]